LCDQVPTDIGYLLQAIECNNVCLTRRVDGMNIVGGEAIVHIPERFFAMRSYNIPL